jgi:hypothetical protein
MIFNHYYVLKLYIFPPLFIGHKWSFQIQWLFISIFFLTER